MKKITIGVMWLLISGSVLAEPHSCVMGELCKVSVPTDAKVTYKHAVLRKDGNVFIPINLNDKPVEDSISIKQGDQASTVKFFKVRAELKTDTSDTERESWTPEQARLAAKERTIIKAVITEDPNVDNKKYPIFKQNLQDDYVYPCEGEVVSEYGVMRQYGKLKLPHGGIDYKCEDQAKAVMNGVVSYVGVTPIENDYVVVISHGQKVYSLYRHITHVKVKQGDEVTYNDSLGYVGDHLHFGIYVDGNNINPDSFVQYIYGD